MLYPAELRGLDRAGDAGFGRRAGSPSGIVAGT